MNSRIDKIENDIKIAGMTQWRNYGVARAGGCDPQNFYGVARVSFCYPKNIYII